MIRINTLEIAGFAGALKALRLPFGREMRSNIETYNIPDNSRLEASYLWESNTKIDIDEKDLALMQTLIKRGDEHAKAEIPMGKQLTKIDFFSYQCLRNIYKQRRNHRLKEWHQFCNWIETLPYAKELIIGEGGAK